jgi:ribosomal-protein-alanine N-acetyltransferase
MLGLGSGPAGTGDIVIDGARANDVPAMLELLKTANMHYIPSKEVPDFDWCAYFVARAGDQLVGLAGYKILSETEGKTTLMVVHPNARGHGTGLLLQAARLRAMACRGVRTVITNADRPDTIAWYKRHFGYMEIGRLKKIHEFGDPNIPEWTTLRMDLVAWVKRQETDYMEGLT